MIFSCFPILSYNSFLSWLYEAGLGFLHIQIPSRSGDSSGVRDSIHGVFSTRDYM